MKTQQSTKLLSTNPTYYIIGINMHSTSPILKNSRDGNCELIQVLFTSFRNQVSIPFVSQSNSASTSQFLVLDALWCTLVASTGIGVNEVLPSAYDVCKMG